MRQAGRSLPEYRELRERHAFWEVAGTPELCAEVTLQPVRRHGVDAAVLFADIMTPVVAMGLDVELVEGVGPVVATPVRTLEDVARLRVPRPARVLHAGARGDSHRSRRARPRPGPRRVLRRAVHRRRLPRRGPPLARLHAGRSRSCTREPAVWHALLDKLADCFAGYLAAQEARAPTCCSSSTRGSACCRRPTTTSSSRPVRAGPRRASTCRRSISARVRAGCSNGWRQPVET